MPLWVPFTTLYKIFVTEAKFSGVSHANTPKYWNWACILRENSKATFRPKWPLKMDRAQERGFKDWAAHLRPNQIEYPVIPAT